MATRAPSTRNWRAVSSPMPLLPPVTRARLFFSLFHRGDLRRNTRRSDGNLGRLPAYPIIGPKTVTGRFSPDSDKRRPYRIAKGLALGHEKSGSSSSAALAVISLRSMQVPQLLAKRRQVWGFATFPFYPRGYDV